MAHQRWFSDWPNEPWAGYARVVRAGNTVWVSGTTATEGDRVVSVGDMYGQARRTLEKIAAQLQRAGAELEHVVQTRAYLTDMSRVADFARAHHEFFEKICPVNTTVEVTRLAHRDMLIEIEAVAVIPQSVTGDRP